MYVCMLEYRDAAGGEGVDAGRDGEDYRGSGHESGWGGGGGDNSEAEMNSLWKMFSPYSSCFSFIEFCSPRILKIIVWKSVFTHVQF